MEANNGGGAAGGFLRQPILGNMNEQPIALQSLNVNPLKYVEKLQMFDGRKEDLPTFLMNVDEIIPTLERYDEQSQRMVMNIIKSKLINRARQAMEIHSHLTRWVEIKPMLILNFSSFKTSNQLYEDLRGAQYRDSVIDFYNFIQRTLSLLNQKCVQENSQHLMPRNIETALTIFKERLPVNMRTILFALRPATIELALAELTTAGFLNEENKKRRNERYDNNRMNSINEKTDRNGRNHNKNYKKEDRSNNWQPKTYQVNHNQHNNNSLNRPFNNPNTMIVYRLNLLGERKNLIASSKFK